MADLLSLVRRAASSRVADGALVAGATDPDNDWRATEQALAQELGTSPRRARKLVDAFARLAALSGNDEAIGRAARLRGSLLTYQGRFAESRREYRRAIASLTGAARDGARIGLAGAELRLGRFDVASALCRAARRAARARGDEAIAAAAEVNEAIALHESGRLRAALAHYERAAEALAAGGNALVAAQATMNRANVLVLLDRYEEALPLFESVARVFESLGLAFDANRCRANLGALLVSMERLGEADVVLRTAEAAFRAAGDPVQAALCRVDRGEALLRAGLLPEALRALESARKALASGAPPVEAVRAASLAARAALALGDVRAARRHAAGLVGAKDVGAVSDRDEILGRALAAAHRTAAARASLERAAAGFGSSRPAARARCLAAAASCALAERDVTGTRRLALSARRAAHSLGVPSLDFAAAAVLFLAEDAAGRRAAAGRELRRAVEALERVRAGLGADAMRSALLGGREAWMGHAVRHLLDGPDGDRRALALAERFRARALVDLLGAADAVAPRDEKIAALRARVARLERAAEGTPPTGFLRGAAPPRSAGALRSAERALADASAAGPGAPLLDAADVRKVCASLPEGTLVLSLFDDGTDVVVFAADRNSVRAAVVAGARGALVRTVEDLRYTLGKFALGEDYVRRHGARLSDDVAARLSELARTSIDPVAAEIGRATRIVVVPHGPWHLVPFAALPFRGRPLIEHATVALAPAVGSLRADVPTASGRALVLAAADAAAPTIDAEARAVAATIPGARLLAGDDACLAALDHADAPSCVHVAAHGRFRPDAPAMGGVRLADGWLRAIDFASLRLPGALVVLSGCETAVTYAGPGDEAHGLIRGVLASGAAEVVAALWRVGDASTASFMVEFHARRTAGLDAEEALAATQRDAHRRGLPPWAWAGFALWTRRLAPNSGRRVSDAREAALS